MYVADGWHVFARAACNRTALLAAVVVWFASGPALADELSSQHAEEKAPAAAPKPWTFSLELSPEVYAINNGSNHAGSLNNIYYKAGLSYRSEEGFLGGVSFQHSIKASGGSQYYSEATVGYRWKWTEDFSLTPSGGAGYTWQQTGIIQGADTNADIGYYVIYLAGDLKMTPKLTWNAFNLRYRNGFDATWVTPKVSTGLTYEVNSSKSLFMNVGYAWKKLATDTPPYDELSGDKINLAVGFKHSF